MQKIIYTCDICQKVKGEANHWFLYLRTPMFKAIPWNEDQPLHLFEHACGLACLHTAMDRALTQKEDPKCG